MKYTFIVNPFNVLKCGHGKVQKIFLATYLAVSFVNGVYVVATKDFESYKSLRICFGLANDEFVKKTGQRLLLCNLKEMGIDESANVHLKNGIQTLCALRSVSALTISSNLIEAFFYFKIFTKMKRCIIIYHIYFIFVNISFYRLHVIGILYNDSIIIF
jgi:hypothetical protein